MYPLPYQSIRRRVWLHRYRQRAGGPARIDRDGRDEESLNLTPYVGEIPALDRPRPHLSARQIVSRVRRIHTLSVFCSIASIYIGIDKYMSRFTNIHLLSCRGAG